MLLIAILVAEVLFWVLLLAGLFTRYALKAPRVGAALLIATPVVDLVFLALVYIDLSNGGSPNFAHGLSAVYIGYSIALGPTIIKSLDRRFQRHFGNGRSHASDVPSQNYRDALATWKRSCLAALISICLLVIGIFIAGFEASFWLIYWLIVTVSIVVLWWYIGPFREKRKEEKATETSATGSSMK